MYVRVCVCMFVRCGTTEHVKHSLTQWLSQVLTLLFLSCCSPSFSCTSETDRELGRSCLFEKTSSRASLSSSSSSYRESGGSKGKREGRRKGGGEEEREREEEKGEGGGGKAKDRKDGSKTGGRRQ